MLVAPSAHFHFVDLAHSFLDGRLDTDTPRRRAGSKPRADDPAGLQDAVNRHLGGPKGTNGWNDWASYRVLTLKGGQTVRGVFPFKDTNGPRKHELWTLDGASMVVDVANDLQKGCDPKRTYARCDETVWQVSFPPFPAVVMLPLAAAFGYDVNDVWVTLLFAVASPLLLFFWLGRMRADGLAPLRDRDRVWWCLAFAFGTVAWYCGIRGQVWFTALTMGVTLHFAYLIAAWRARFPLLAGVILGVGVATRTPLLFSALFLPLEAFFPDGRWLGGRGREGLAIAVRKVALFALPMAMAGAALAWYNWARWDNPLEFGHLYLLEGGRGPTREHGLFSFFFLNNNLSAALTNMPRLVAHSPWLQVTRHGLGILVCSPMLLALLGRRGHANAGVDATAPEATGDEADLVRRRDSVVRHLWVSVLAVAIPALLYQNDGWEQFGYRFALDFWPPLAGILALRLPKLDRRVRVLIVLAIVIQLFGAITFGRMGHFYYD